MHSSSVLKRALIGLSVTAAVAGVCTFSAGVANAATCADVEVVFARGTLELPGTGMVGGPLADGIRSKLPGKSVNTYAVDYAADVLQTSAGAGATDMTKHVKQVAQQCPNTKFVVGGYSQGASVTDIALGIPTVLGAGDSIPADLDNRVAAVAVFGNPLRLFGQNIVQNSPRFGGKAIDLCNAGDPVCGAGVNVLAHLTYGFDGSAAKAADFAAQKLR